MKTFIQNTTFNDSFTQSYTQEVTSTYYVPGPFLGKLQLLGMRLSSCPRPPGCHMPAQSDAGLYTHFYKTSKHIHEAEVKRNTLR